MIYGVSSWIVPVALGTIATPIIVKSLGPRQYGIYALVLGLIAYSFNFNVGRAVTKYLAEYRSAGETGKIRSVLAATFAVNLVVGTLGLIVTILLAPYLVSRVFQIEESFREEALTAVYLSAFIIFAFIWGQVFNAVLQGLNRIDVYSKVQNLTSFVMVGGSICIALAGYGLRELLYWNLATTTLGAVLAALCSYRLLPEFAFSVKTDSEALRKVIWFSAPVVGYQIVANVVLLFERGWITAKLGSEALTYYVVPMTPGILLHGFAFSAMITLFPVVSAIDDRTQLLALYRKASKTISFIAVFSVASLIALNQPILALWVGPDFAAQSGTLLILHSLTFGMLAVVVVAYQLADGVGLPTFGFWATLCVLFIGLPMMVTLVPFGNLGIAVARLAAFSVMIPGVAILERRVFGQIQTRFWLESGIRLLLAGTAAGLAEMLLRNIVPDSWWGLGLEFATGGAVYCLVLLAVGFVAEEERELINSVRARVGLI